MLGTCEMTNSVKAECVLNFTECHMWLALLPVFDYRGLWVDVFCAVCAVNVTITALMLSLQEETVFSTHFI